MKELTIILGNQLFDYKFYRDLPNDVFMCEDMELCTHFKYHKHKIMHFLVSMREYADLLKERGKNVTYVKLSKQKQYISCLEKVIKQNSITHVHLYEIEDLFFELKLSELFEKLNVQVTYYNSPMFTCSRDEFKQYLENNRPFMNSFYIMQRKKLGIMIDRNQNPEGGKWSFDSENRKKIPKNFDVKEFIPENYQSEHLSDIIKLVEKYFSNHPGTVENFWIPCNRKDSIKWFKQYLGERFKHFGDFQDAIDDRAPFLYHSVISPMMNIGHLLPDEIVREILKHKKDVEMNTVEGFIRQVIGWREFVRGIYQNFDPIQQIENFFGNTKKLTKHWYDGTTGIPPLDDAIKKSVKWGYCHHIERLMVLSNIMLLLRIHPQEVYKWFMEMFVDSSDWVMGPNVFGMGQFSDGGIFATKPYICGSNYIRKMGHYKDEDWCDALDGLYWKFIEDHKEFFSKNPRMAIMVKSVQKMDSNKKSRIYKAAKELEQKITK